jgi:hypothetical protein
MLTHLHMMVKHLWCWHICKGSEGGKEGNEVLHVGAPSPPVRCTTTPVVVTTFPRLKGWLGHWHRHVHDGAPLGPVRCHRRFYPESGDSGVGTAAVTTTPVTVHRPNYLGRGVSG